MCRPDESELRSSQPIVGWGSLKLGAMASTTALALRPAEGWRSLTLGWWIAAIAPLAAAAVAFVLILDAQLLRLFSVSAPSWDLGFHQQLLWSLANGHGWSSSFEYGHNFIGRADDQVKITITTNEGASPASPLRPDIMKAFTRITDTMWPGVVTVPTMAVGGSDGRYLRLAGIPAYGVQGFFQDRDDVRAHGRDERMLVRSVTARRSCLRKGCRPSRISASTLSQVFDFSMRR